MRFIQAVWLLVALASSPGLGLRLATTTSVYDSGLLDRLLPAFERAMGVRVEVLAVGTGQALRLAERKDVDAVLVHAPDLEGEALERGIIAQPFCLAQNSFLLVGPKGDPARIREAGDVLEALRRIARAQAPFVSRGDRSGTHLKELELWRKAGLTPEGGWYLESGAGMGQTLVLAAEKGAYTLSDLATYLTVGRKRGLEALYRREDPLLLNQYTYYLVPQGAKAEEAEALRRFLATEEAARLVEGLQVEGTPLFKPLRGRCIIPRGGGR
ncbi:ABC transporter substrate-binding protein [Thermus scotoductus]|uniref:ABC transporter substrate-binding protein n=1 Tax=Thermus scotoductus TaxID=37636 RepID=A0A430RYN6_THESC|nr:substrate-binding domain-containing protein [Thermus scotoductus]RTG95507.1 ABC transporter substrate-binding protein [Thermus scotoductus]RTG95666.1 ABC transporter substrate-binding protein [Thermus scotoductus]RTH02224.1 ABC transporter substrate-binding protein [Thermus scotoductus]RTH08162.1 ABC transporter substrate-binding protein [Thermus scotoductus]RTH10743.1 ABC transporter substrate-binding protein [Thermus scotoductus]